MLDNVLIYNPSCSKSRKALKLVAESGLVVKKREYLKKPLTIEELKRLTALLKCSIFDLVRRKEVVFVEKNLSQANESNLLAAIAESPILLERPILINNGKAVLARPPELVLQVL